MVKFLEFITEGFGWLQIVLSLLIIGLGLGYLVYYLIPDTTGLVIAAIVAAGGLITGIVIATRIWKKTGTINFLSRVGATPKLDKMEKEEKGK